MDRAGTRKHITSSAPTYLGLSLIPGLSHHDQSHIEVSPVDTPTHDIGRKLNPS